MTSTQQIENALRSYQTAQSALLQTEELHAQTSSHGRELAFAREWLQKATDRLNAATEPLSAGMLVEVFYRPETKGFSLGVGELVVRENLPADPGFEWWWLRPAKVDRVRPARPSELRLVSSRDIVS